MNLLDVLYFNNFYMVDIFQILKLLKHFRSEVSVELYIIGKSFFEIQFTVLPSVDLEVEGTLSTFWRFDSMAITPLICKKNCVKSFLPT